MRDGGGPVKPVDSATETRARTGEPAAGPMTAEGGETLAETAYERLRADIISGVRPPSERLRIEHLKSLYRIGPTPLREALQRLSVDGLVLAEPNRGFMVAPLEAEEFQDLNIARIAIEKEALRLAIAHGNTDWEAGIVAAAYALSKEDAVLRASDTSSLDAWERANRAFHDALVAACGSRWLLRVRKTLHDQCQRYRRASVDLRRRTRDLEAEHRQIREAVLARDPERACALIEHHFTTTAATLIDELSRARAAEG